MFIVHFHYIRTSDVLKNDKHVQTKNTLDSRVFFKSFMLSSPCTVWLGYHEFQVPKMEVVNLIGGGGPLLTGYIGEDSSILGTWNVNGDRIFIATDGSKWLVTTTWDSWAIKLFQYTRKSLVGWFNFFNDIMRRVHLHCWGIFQLAVVLDTPWPLPDILGTFEKTKMIQFCPDHHWNGLKPTPWYIIVVSGCNCRDKSPYPISNSGAHDCMAGGWFGWTTPNTCKFGSDNFLKGCGNWHLWIGPQGILPKDWRSFPKVG